jgi:hypothetical protein
MLETLLVLGVIVSVLYWLNPNPDEDQTFSGWLISLAFVLGFVVLVILTLELWRILSPYILPWVFSEWAIAPAILLALLLYRLRGNRPFTYGLAEIFVGVATVWYSIHSEMPEPYYLAKAIALLGGIYIIVRGLDNMDRGLPQRMRPRWDRYFPKAPHP